MGFWRGEKFVWKGSGLWSARAQFVVEHEFVSVIGARPPARGTEVAVRLFRRRRRWSRGSAAD